MTDAFKYYLRVRYGECDAQKVVFNARYAEYVDLASVEFFRALGYGEAFITGQLDFQLVRQTLEWKAPARFDQVLEIAVAAKHLGNTSFTLGTEFRVAGDPRVYVLVDSRTLGKMALTPELRAALGLGGAGKHVDHAAWLPPDSA